VQVLFCSIKAKKQGLQKSLLFLWIKIKVISKNKKESFEKGEKDMYNFRTDMALERKEIYRKANKLENEVEGIETEEEKSGDDIVTTRVKVLNEKRRAGNRKKSR